MSKPVTMEELEKQLKLAQDRIFVMKYYKFEEENYSLTMENEELKRENKRLRAAFESNVKFNPTETLYDIEREMIEKALKFYDGNKTQTAESLGITVKTLYNKLHEFGMLG